MGEKVVNPEVTVVMPCLNEAETLATCIEKIIKTFQFHNIMGEIIVADNGSTDGSQKIAMDSGARVVPVARRGYGAALQGGIAAASAPYIIMGDADDSYDFREMPRFIEALRNGHDFVMGCRFPAGGGEIKPGAMPFLHRYLGTPVLTALGQIFFHHRFKDVNCGMRGFTKRAFEEMALQSDGMEFASEMVARAAMINLKSCEVPVTLHPDGRSRAPHLRTWRDGWRHLKFMLLLCPRWLYRMPGLFLSLLGGIMTLILAITPLSVQGITLDIHTLMVFQMILFLGLQILLFGHLASYYAEQNHLIPPSHQKPWVNPVESGALWGGLFMILGASGLIYTFDLWRDVGFGPLEASQTLRLFSISIFGIILGLELIFVGFLFGLFDLMGKRNKDHTP
jgi:glycosyltransferase involved in cell wall biosynthesis